MATKGTSFEYNTRYRELKNDVIADIEALVGKKKVNFDEPFADEANNDIYAVDADNVYFNGTMESYPLRDLGVLDAILIVSLLEN